MTSKINDKIKELPEYDPLTACMEPFHSAVEFAQKNEHYWFQVDADLYYRVTSDGLLLQFKKGLDGFDEKHFRDIDIRLLTAVSEMPFF